MMHQVSSVSEVQQEVVSNGQAALYGANEINGGVNAGFLPKTSAGSFDAAGPNRPVMLETRLVRAILSTTKGLAIIDEAAKRALGGNLGWRKAPKRAKRKREGGGGGTESKKSGASGVPANESEEMKSFPPRVERMLLDLFQEAAPYVFDRKFVATRAVPDIDELQRSGWDVGGKVDVYIDQETGRHVLAGADDLYESPDAKSTMLKPRDANDPRNNVPMRIVVPAPSTGHYYAVINRITTCVDVIWRYKPGFGSGASGGVASADHIGMSVDAKEAMKASVGSQRCSSPGVSVFVWPGGRPMPELVQPLQSVVAPLVPSYQRLEQAWAYWYAASRARSSILLVHGTGHAPQTSMSDKDGDVLSGTDIFALCVRAGRSDTTMQYEKEVQSIEQAVRMQRVIHNNMVALGAHTNSNNLRLGAAGQLEQMPGALADSINTYMLPPGQATQSWPAPTPPAELMQMKEEFSIDVDQAFGRQGGQRQRQNKMGGGGGEGGIGATRAQAANVDALALVLRTAFQQLFGHLVRQYGKLLFEDHNRKVKKKFTKQAGRITDYREYLTYAKLTGQLREEPEIDRIMLEEETRRSDAQFAELESRAIAIQEQAKRERGLQLTAGNIMDVIRDAEERAIATAHTMVSDEEMQDIELVFERDIVADLEVLQALQAAGSIRSDSVTRMTLRYLGIPEGDIEIMTITDEQKVEAELDIEEKKAKIAADNRPPPASASGGGSKPKPKSSSSSSSSKK